MGTIETEDGVTFITDRPAPTEVRVRSIIYKRGDELRVRFSDGTDRSMGTCLQVREHTAMTYLECVLAEHWSATSIAEGHDSVGQLIAGDRVYNIGAMDAHVAVLGKESMAFLIEHEWKHENGLTQPCLGCDGVAPDVYDLSPAIFTGRTRGHTPDCKWGKIVNASKALG